MFSQNPQLLFPGIPSEIPAGVPSEILLQEKYFQGFLYRIPGIPGFFFEGITNVLLESPITFSRNSTKDSSRITNRDLSINSVFPSVISSGIRQKFPPGVFFFRIALKGFSRDFDKKNTYSYFVQDPTKFRLLISLGILITNRPKILSGLPPIIVPGVYHDHHGFFQEFLQKIVQEFLQRICKRSVFIFLQVFPELSLLAF